MFNRASFHYFIVDKTMRNALPPAGPAAEGRAASPPPPIGPAAAVAEHEPTLAVSCWMPPLARLYLDQVLERQAAQRERCEEDAFNIYVPVSPDRADEWVLRLLFEVARRIRLVVIHIECHPSLCAAVIRDRATEFAASNGLDGDQFVQKHIRFVQWRPIVQHMIWMKENMHLAMNAGFYPGHTGHSAALGASLLTMAFEGAPGDYSFLTWAAASTNRFAGLAALNIKDGPFSAKLERALTLVQQLVDDEPLRRAGGVHLEEQSRKRSGFFNFRRLQQDFGAIAEWVRHSEGFESGAAPAEDPFAKAEPAREVYQVGHDGKLQIAPAQAPRLGSDSGAALAVAESGSERLGGHRRERSPSAVEGPEMGSADAFKLIAGAFPKKNRESLDWNCRF